MKKVLQIAITFLFLFVCFGYAGQAQYNCSTPGNVCYEDNVKGRFATGDTRVAATIKEKANGEVHIECVVIGFIKLGAATLSLQYNNAEVYPIDGPGGTEILTNLNAIAGSNDLGNYLKINNDLPGGALSWEDGTSGQVNPQTMLGQQYWTFIRCAQLEDAYFLTKNDGEMGWMFTVYFKKRDGSTIDNNTFKYFNRTLPPITYNEIVQGSTYVRSIGTPSTAVSVNGNIFSLRVPAEVTTGIATTPTPSTANLLGVAKVANTGIAKIAGPNGLDWDNIIKAGFIYSENPVKLSFKDYVNNTIYVNGTPYSFSLTSLVNGGTFIVGGYTFNVVEHSIATYPQINMSIGLNGLNPATRYYAQAFLTYDFQTSNVYPLLGDSVSFSYGCTPVFPPSVNPQYKVCASGGLKLSDIPVQGTNIQWYADEELETPLTAASVTLTDKTIYWVTQTIAGCESDPSRVQVIFVNATELKPVAIASPQYFCSGTYTLANIKLPAGVTVKWYDAGGAPLAGSSAIVNGGTYFASLVQGTCESAERTQVNVVIGGTVPAPNVPTSQYFCDDARVGNLNTGLYNPSDIIWYKESPGVTALNPTDKLTSGIYYAALSVSAGCESALKMVTVVISTSNPSPVTETQEFCGSGKTVADIVISTNFGWGTTKWFNASNVEITNPAATPLVHNATYYLYNNFGTCSIANMAVTVKVYDNIQKPVLTSATPIEHCSGTLITKANLVALITPVTDITFKIFTDAACTTEFVSETLTATTTPVTKHYYAKPFAGIIMCEGGTGTVLDITVTVNPRPAAPTYSGAPRVICEGPSAITSSFLTTLITNPGTGTVQFVDAGGSLLTLPFNAVVGDTTVYARTIFTATGCTSSGTLLPITITVNPRPGTPVKNNSDAIEICETVTLDATYLRQYFNYATGTSIEFYTDAACTIPFAGIPSASTAAAPYILYAVTKITATGCETASTNALQISVGVIAGLPTPGINSAIPAAVCDGDPLTNAFLSTLVTSSVPNVTFKFYTNSACTILFTDILSTNYATTNAYTFYVLAVSNVTGCFTPVVNALTLNVVVNPRPGTPILNAPDGTTICEGEILNAAYLFKYFTYNPVTDTIKFYTNSGCTNPFTPTQASLSASPYILYVTLQNKATGCETDAGVARTIGVIVTPGLAAPTRTSAPAAVCDGDIITTTFLNSLVTSAAAGVIFQFYTDAACTVPFTVPVTTNYIVKNSYQVYAITTKAGECSTPAAKALSFTITVNPRPGTPALSNVSEEITTCIGLNVEADSLRTYFNYNAALTTIEFYWDAACTIPFTGVIASFEASPYTLFAVEKTLATGCETKALSALQIAVHVVICKVFEIWNWEDLAKLNEFMSTPAGKTQWTIYGSTATLMQDLGIPGQKGTYGYGIGMKPEIQDTHKGYKRFGWYGYEGFVGDPAMNDILYSDIGDDDDLLDFFGNFLPTTQYDNPLFLFPLSSETGWHSTEGWKPIGTQPAPFKNIFDGQGFAITGLWTNRPTADNQGLFGCTNNATITNLGVNIGNTDKAGKNAVVGKDNIGGMAGNAIDTEISGCYTTGVVSGILNVGGFMGNISNVIANSCYATGEVKGTASIGGFAGYLRANTILTNSYATGNVTASNVIGGLVGVAENTTIENCYATGIVTANTTAGGLVGATTNNATIKNCFALNPKMITQTTTNVGRILGSRSAGSILIDNYALECERINGLVVPVGAANSNDGAHISLDNVLNPTQFATFATNWNFTEVWIFDGVYAGYGIVTTEGEETNLPILRAFTLTDFSSAVQPPHAYCIIGTKLMGTVFPFVNWEGFDELNQLFPITVSLKEIPTVLSDELFYNLINATPLYSTTVRSYTGADYIPKTPKYPGVLGAYNNPGLPISWYDKLGKIVPPLVSNDTVARGSTPDNIEGNTLGLFEIKEVAAGDYVLEINRDGFLIRWAKITVYPQDEIRYLGHREIIPGAVVDGLQINTDDTQVIIKHYNTSFFYGTGYDPKYDFYGRGMTDSDDTQLIRKYYNAFFDIYEESEAFFSPLFGF